MNAVCHVGSSGVVSRAFCRVPPAKIPHLRAFLCLNMSSSETHPRAITVRVCEPFVHKTVQINPNCTKIENFLRPIKYEIIEEYQ